MTTLIKYEVRDQTNIDKYGAAANITEYHILLNSIFLRIIIPKFMMIRQFFHVKNICKNAKNVLNGYMDYVGQF